MRQFSLVLLGLLTIHVRQSSSSLYNLVVNNTGPAVLRSPIRFTVSFRPFFWETYMVKFEDDTPEKLTKVLYAQNRATADFTYNFKEVDLDKNYRMRVEVWSMIVNYPFSLVASAESYFKVSDRLLGHLNISELGIPPESVEKSIVAANRTTAFTSVVYDPIEFFRDGKKKYSWSIDSSPLECNSSVLTYNFTTAKQYNVEALVKVNVTKNNVTTEFEGVLNRTVEVKSPVSAIAAQGKRVITRDDDLDLQVTCEGSPPFWYCADVIPATNSSQNISCDEDIYIRKCSFRVVRYLRTNGSYLLFVKIRNDVTLPINKTIEVTILDINNQPQLSVVIIPVFSTILAILIILGGIAYHLKHRERYAVEVADFDFQQHDDLQNLCEKTLMERIQDSFSSSLKRGILTTCGGSPTYDSLINDGDITPTDVLSDDNCDADRRNRVGLGSPVDSNAQ